MPKKTPAACACLLCLPLATAQVGFQTAPDKIGVSIAGRPFSNLYYGPQWSKPFLHPLRAASGLTLTRGYPLETIPGESQDHAWHHGLWYAHGDINGVDFWRDKGPQASGRIVANSPPVTEGRELCGDFLLVAPGRQLLGSIREVFRFAAVGATRLVDVEVTIRADRGVALKMGDTEEGSLGLRLRDEFREDRGAVLRNSQGLVGSRNIWGKRARWVDYSTTIEAEAVGVTIIDHPDNPKYPTYWHARGYGLCAANPFGEHDFLKDPARDGSLTLAAGASLRFRYRVVIHPGILRPADADKWADDFAKED